MFTTTLFAYATTVPVHEKTAGDMFYMFIALIVAIFFILFIFKGATR